MLPSNYQDVIYKSRYARWLPEEKRRENFDETVDRYLSFMERHLKESVNYGLPEDLKGHLRDNILSLKVMPSMRALMTAGPALERDNICGYNCSYLPVDSPRAFDECLYILMCGTGVGFSVERDYVRKLPVVNEHFERTDTTIIVQDSKAGWARALRELISLLYSGQIPSYDTSKLRVAGSPLKTFGGRSSGPEPLRDLFEYTIELFKRAAGRKLSALECHDLMCKIASVVVVGGVRRSALISLSDFSDDRMRHAKTGRWWDDNSQRGLANNSIAYTEKPDVISFLREWTALVESGSGERGIFYRKAAKNQAAKNGRRDTEHEFGTNPCSEIILRPYQFCNLTEVVIRERDTLEDLANKVQLATMLGTFQSTLTDFKYLRKIWRENTEEERLLGVSFTGIMDHPILGDYKNSKAKQWLKFLKEVAVETNRVFAERLGIPVSTAITCCKPSGTVSQLVDSSSGIHPRYAKHYIRTIRGDNNDPLTKFLTDQGVPSEPDQSFSKNTTVFSFPIKAPTSSKVAGEVTALDQLELWKLYQDEWCEHKPSCTVYVRPHEWIEVGNWVYKNFDTISGISFLPYSDHTYKQAPYQPITEEEYNNFPKVEVNWEEFNTYEQTDTTTGSQELACSGGVCEIAEIGTVDGINP